MELSFLKSLGLYTDLGETVRAVEGAKQKWIEPPEPYTHISVYDDPSGACVALLDRSDGDVREAFTVHGVGGHTVAASQINLNVAQIDLLEPNGELAGRFTAMVDDPHMYPAFNEKPAIYQNYELGAIAVDLTVWDSVEEWETAQEPVGDNGELMGPLFIASPWLFAFYQGTAPAEEVSAVSIFAGIIKQVEVVKNQLTGNPWYRAVVDCGFDCALALPIDTAPTPHPGSVVDGKAFLTGTTGFWGPPIYEP
ncbi:MAG: hypothetical protein Q4D87_00235 [Actinomycetaceae bacterium]|nr:hypothetical protein [Actinomycetaceae bacterium]